MAKAVERLSPKTVEKAQKRGVLHDGRGLYLHIGPTGGKSWLYRYQVDGKARWMGLGPYPEIGLARAREKVLEARRLRVEGMDPLAEQHARRAAAKAEAARKAAEAITFKTCAEKYVAAHEASWRNPVHRAQWSATLATYVLPRIGDLPVGAIDTGHVTAILEPIWTTKTETASRVRGRIESILDYAKTHGWRTHENPARWRGHLENVLPARGRVAKVEHHPALLWREIGSFMADLAKQDGMGPLALRFAILTAARTGEVIGARWSEIDMQHAVWMVPPERMKAAREHRVPLADAAIELLTKLADLRCDPSPHAVIFRGQAAGKPLSNMALLMTLRRMKRGDLTAHGFRSTFRDWCAETGKPSDIAEAALAHVVGDKTVAAYQRGDLLERRRKLMAQWADWCGRPAAGGENVVALHQAEAAA